MVPSRSKRTYFCGVAVMVVFSGRKDLDPTFLGGCSPCVLKACAGAQVLAQPFKRRRLNFAKKIGTPPPPPCGRFCIACKEPS